MFISEIMRFYRLIYRFFRTSLFFLSFFLCFFQINYLTSFAEGISSESSNAVQRVFSELRSKRYWQVDFEEITFDSSGIISRVGGLIKFREPFNFEISYEDGKKRVLSDGELIYFVFSDKKRVFVRPITQEVSQDLIFEILKGTLDVERYFTVLGKGQDTFLIYPRQGTLSNKIGRIKIETMKFGFPIRSVEILDKSEKFGVRLILKKVRYEDEEINFEFGNYNMIFDSSVPSEVIEKLKMKGK